MNGKLSEYFCNNTGLMQGEVLSPILFNLYVNDIEMNFLKSQCVPYEILSLNLFTLMYADDMVLFSESIEGLQNLLDELNEYCIAWKLSVNVAKSKIVIFRKGGKVKNDEKWVFRNENLEIVNNFTYLGIVFNFNNKFSKAEKQLAVQARKATFLLKKNVKNMYLNHKTLLFLFDCYCPIVNYGSEIWSTQKGLNVERIHLDFCKHTCTAAVYAELGRFPLFYHRKFANTGVNDYIYSNNCILLNCYEKLFDDVENHKKTNSMGVKNCLINLV